MNFSRYLKAQIELDLGEKMVFLGGPRQVGKTTLAKSFIRGPAQYLNWDLVADRQKVLKDQIDPKVQLLVLDEIHKYRNWRNLVKGYYDKYFPDLNFIVTGSARLDHFRKGGDSLVGRYHYLRLHPLSLDELSKQPNEEDLRTLLKFGGFPEPLVKQTVVHHQRWQLERVSKVVTQDLTDLETVKDVSLIELLVVALQKAAGSTLSIKSLQEDLQVSPNTVARWVELLEKLYYCYRIPPFGPTKIKAVKKAQKLYLWDWSEVEDSGARFENLVASHLLKYAHFQEDCFGRKTEVRYFKDTQFGNEIDFIVLRKGKPLFAVECKTGERERAKSLLRFGQRLGISKLYQVHTGKKDYGSPDSVRVLPFVRFWKDLWESDQGIPED